MTARPECAHRRKPGAVSARVRRRSLGQPAGDASAVPTICGYFLARWPIPRCGIAGIVSLSRLQLPLSPLRMGLGEAGLVIEELQRAVVTRRFPSPLAGIVDASPPVAGVACVPATLLDALQHLRTMHRLIKLERY